MGMESYRGRRALVTGGLGFVGSNLVLRLLGLGAEVTVIDSLVEGCGGNQRNLDSVRGEVQIVRSDIGDADKWTDLLEDCDIVFNLAGEISHVTSMRDPERDLRLNTLSQLKFLLALTEANPGVRVVYAGTRQVCGRPRYLPVDEDHPVEPVDFNGIHKRAAEHYHLLLSRNGQIDACVLRLSNVYGPRLALDVPHQGFFTVFLSRVLEGKSLSVFGDGKQLRDPVYVDDVVEAFLLAGSKAKLPAPLYHLGGPESLSLLDIAHVMHRAAGVRSPVVLTPFPPEHKVFDIGSYASNNKRIQRDLGWSPETSFSTGLRRTLNHFASPESLAGQAAGTAMEPQRNRSSKP